jgi:small conductance mechanosensitive channel
MEELSSAQTWIVENGFTLATKLVIALLLIVVGRFIISMVSGLINKSLKKVRKLNELLRNFLVTTLRQALWILLYVLVAAQFIDVMPIIAGLGILGIVVGLAFQDTLSNFAAGLMILANDPYQRGHFVEIGGHSGSVADMNIMATTLATPDNRLIVMPNKVIWGSPIVNFSVTGTRRLDLTVGIPYGADINRAKEIARGVLASDQRVLKDPASVVEVVAFDASAITLAIRPWVNTSDFWDLHFALHQRITESFRENGIEIPLPQRVVTMKQVAS